MYVLHTDNGVQEFSDWHKAYNALADAMADWYLSRVVGKPRLVEKEFQEIS